MKAEIQNLVEKLVKNFSHDNLRYLFREKTENFIILEKKLELDVKFDIFSNAMHFGKIELENESRMIVCTFLTNKELSDKSGKKVQYELARKILKENINYDAGFFIFYDSKGDFRLSLVYDIPEGKGKRSWSNFRRYTYYISKDQTNKTFINTFSEIKKFDTLESIIDAFSVEKVTKEFYQKIAILFTTLTGGKRNNGSKSLDMKGELKIPDNNDTTRKEFSVRLLGRLLFSWFLKKKKSTNGTSLISDEVLSRKAMLRADNYYHDIIEPLFFEVLNTKIKERKDIYKDSPWDKVPFLNGGLFEPGNQDYYKLDSFNKSKHLNTLHIPNDWFEELFEVFDQFNFTIDENTTNDAEISIDPEMLGKLFENLLAEINEQTGDTDRKRTGSFYTPRTIVDYMVDESLIEYLDGKLGYEKNEKLQSRLRKLLNYSDDSHDFDDTEIMAIINSLDELKILDPACGSGAFPMGVLHKMQLILQKLDPDCTIWLGKVLDDVKDRNARKMMENKLKGDPELNDFTRKIGIIQKSIYGVDIQEIAVEISKLRCFLSIIVDEKVRENDDNRGIQPLPNLEFKFVAANTLLGLPKANLKAGLFSLDDKFDKLRELREEFFQASGNDKMNAIAKFKNMQDELSDILMKNKNYDKETKEYAAKISGWNPFSHESASWFDSLWMFGIRAGTEQSRSDGFDIVIGNPPYVSIQRMEDTTELKKSNFETFEKTGDLYTIFYEKGINLLKENGILSYISSNKWINANYGKSTRKFFATKTNPLILIDFAKVKIFESATVFVNILIAEKAKNKNQLWACAIQGDKLPDTDLRFYFNTNKFEFKDFNEGIWKVRNGDSSKINAKIDRIAVPLYKWKDVKFYRGITSGLNKAFHITELQKNSIVKKNPKSEEFIKPLIRGKDIKRWAYRFENLYILFIPWHFPLQNEIGITNASLEAEKKFKIEYPEIYKHLSEHKIELSNRNQTETGIRYEWYALQRYGADFWTEFEHPKIVWIEISDRANYAYDETGKFLTNSAYFMTGKHLKYILAVLNSKVADYYFFQITATIAGGRKRYTKQYVEQIPIPQISPKAQQPFVDLVNQILAKKEKGEDTSKEEHQIDQLVYKLYELTDNEIAIVEGKGLA
ncbi:MAG: Eco57I restriction-modification methylase domain-containing protein [Desulfobulbaceae bacterium]|nr:Eco57I restriction-modification methylase domain-containing protein [Desulfobulbaceae bacterium]